MLSIHKNILMMICVFSFFALMGCNEQNSTTQTASKPAETMQEGQDSNMKATNGREATEEVNAEEKEVKPDQQEIKDYLTLASLEDAISKSKKEPVFLFKHSNACPISAAAKDVMNGFVQDGDIPVYMVVVQTERPMSNKIEEQFEIKHESPQLLIVNEGKVDSVFNHYEIRRDHIMEELKSGSES